MLQGISFQDIAGIQSKSEAVILLAGSSVMKVLPARIQFLKGAASHFQIYYENHYNERECHKKN